MPELLDLCVKKIYIYLAPLSGGADDSIFVILVLSSEGEMCSWWQTGVAVVTKPVHAPLETGPLKCPYWLRCSL